MPGLWLRPRESYGGLLMRCSPGTHEAAANLIGRHSVPRGAVLDLAAGTGAFLARLRDCGFADLSAVELDLQEFKLSGVTPQSIDLNTDFAGRFERKFTLITAIEIIEHLDAPRHFLRNIKALLQPGGYVLISTPNVAHWIGRLKFLLAGELRGFAAHDYHYQRHISPITDTQMRLMLKEFGFELTDSTTGGDFAGGAKRLITSPLRMLFALSRGPRPSGDVNIYLARLSAPDGR
jgi:2-polyprenyl-3-methyl-5-hydroxy-6-metoxy-1,4-benzoquinol methylase